MPPFIVGVVVVTYNRKHLLEQTLQNIQAQTYPIAHIIVVDNLSTDGTREFLSQVDDPRIRLLMMKSNLGGAGGFSAGIEHAYDLGSELIWVMDDDVLPDSNALEELIKARARLLRAGVQPSFLISNVSNSSGEPVNAPVLDLRLRPNGNQLWPKFLEDGVIPVVAASFVGTLVSRQAVVRHGLPIAKMFIWGDDIEYTFRLTSCSEQGYVVGHSRIVHLGRNVEVSIHQETSPARIGNFFYFYRNNIYVLRKFGTKQARAAFLLRLVRDVVRLMSGLHIRKLFIVVRGVACGLTFSPQISHVNGGSTPGSVTGNRTSVREHSFPPSTK